MKKIIISAYTLILVFAAYGVSAQMMMGSSGAQGGMSMTSEEIHEHTIDGEKEGKAVWDKLTRKELSCADMSDDQFDELGEYFMGVMMGDSHAAMNEMMMRSHGEDGEEQIHSAMGKRLSGCDTSAAFPEEGSGWMPMMQMMGGHSPDGTWSIGVSPHTMMYGNHDMRAWGWGFGALWLIGKILRWIVIFFLIALFLKWLVRRSRGERSASALDILKERYAKGEMDKKEFDEKKKDIQD